MSVILSKIKPQKPSSQLRSLGDSSGDETRVELLSQTHPAALLIVQDRSPCSPEQKAVVLFWRFRALAQFEISYGRIYSKGKPDSSARACKPSCRFLSSVSRCLPTFFSALVEYRA